jgi:tetratricopeptide (TPR) repeat protein
MKVFCGRMLVTMLAVLICSSCLSPAQQKIKEGDDYLGKQQWDKAVVSYSLAGELDPQLKPVKQIASAYAGQAKKSFDAGDYESAVFNYDKAAALVPDTKADIDIAYARYRTGLLYSQQGKQADALATLRSAINGGYKKGEAYLARGRVYNALGMYSGAIGDATTCLDLDPQSAPALMIRGYAYLFSSEYHKSIQDLSKAVSLDASLGEAYLYRGMAWKETGEFRSAINDFKHVVELDPASTAGLIWLGRSYYQATDYYSAIEQFTRAIELNKSDAAVAFNDRAVCLGRTGEFNAAMSDLNVLIKMKPAFPLAYYNLGVLFMKMNQPPYGVDQLDTYLCLDPMDKFGCRQLAYSWRRYSTDYNLCCLKRVSSDQVQERCDNILAQYKGQSDLFLGKDALYLWTEVSSDAGMFISPGRW